jgi:hypothetical protein
VILEKLRSCPVDNYDTDSSYKSSIKVLKLKYDSLKISNQIEYKIGIQDSFRLDTQKNVLGAETKLFRTKGYECMCYKD